MYIIVDAKTNVIVASALRPVSVEACSRNGQKVYEIPDNEFTQDMIGSKLDLENNNG